MKSSTNSRVLFMFGRIKQNKISKVKVIRSYLKTFEHDKQKEKIILIRRSPTPIWGIIRYVRIKFLECQFANFFQIKHFFKILIQNFLEFGLISFKVFLCPNTFLLKY